MYPLSAAKRPGLIIALAALNLAVALLAALLGAHALRSGDFTYHEECQVTFHTAAVVEPAAHTVHASENPAGGSAPLACVVPLASPAPRPADVSTGRRAAAARLEGRP
jgi:hypothetical protein